MGETSRTAYTRVKEHVSDYRAAMLLTMQPSTDPLKSKDIKSWMWEHTWDKHDGLVGTADYRSKVNGTFLKWSVK